MRPGPQSILVIHFRYLGDMVLLSAVFRNLRLHYPEARLAILADEAYLDVLRCLPDLDEIIAFPRGRMRSGPLLKRPLLWLGVVRKLKRSRFSMVIDIANNKTSRGLLKLLHPEVSVGYDSPRHRYSLAARPFHDDVPHFIDHYLEPLRALGVPIVTRCPVLSPSRDDEATAGQLLNDQRLSAGTFVAIHAGSRLGRKCWPADNFAALAEALQQDLNLRPVLIGGPEDGWARDVIMQHSSVPPVDLVGKLPVGPLAALLQKARLFVGNDSGPMHIAAACGIPVVALFGPSEAHYWAPLGEAHTILKRDCPCGLDMRRPTACDTEGAACLKQISVAEVLAAVRGVVTAAPPK